MLFNAQKMKIGAQGSAGSQDLRSQSPTEQWHLLIDWYQLRGWAAERKPAAERMEAELTVRILRSRETQLQAGPTGKQDLGNVPIFHRAQSLPSIRRGEWGEGSPQNRNAASLQIHANSDYYKLPVLTACQKPMYSISPRERHRSELQTITHNICCLTATNYQEGKYQETTSSCKNVERNQ